MPVMSTFALDDPNLWKQVPDGQKHVNYRGD
jgi:hypothetical protein